MLRTALLLTLGASALAASAQPRGSREQATIARELRGLEPGPPQECIVPSRNRGSTHIGDTILIRDTRNVPYISKFRGGCSIRPTDALVLRTTSSQLCRGEIVEGVDFVTGFPSGSCSYGDFVPYRKPR